jgi:ubiquinone/menaquinone biosynthesis C-methylase UbiE
MVIESQPLQTCACSMSPWNVDRAALVPRARSGESEDVMMRNQTIRRVMFDVGALPYAILTAQPTWRAHGGELADLVEVKSGDRLLDLGCGPGVSAFGVLERVPGLRVTGLDASPSMIRFARMFQRFEKSGTGVEFVEGDAMHLGYEARSFEAVIGHSFLYLVPDADQVLAEVARVLTPGGMCAFLEPHAEASGFLPREIRRQALRDPRFVTSMALWRIVSGGYGRFDQQRFGESFARAGLELVRCIPTLSGLGLFGVGRKPG